MRGVHTTRQAATHGSLTGAKCPPAALLGCSVHVRAILRSWKYVGWARTLDRLAANINSRTKDVCDFNIEAVCCACKCADALLLGGNCGAGTTFDV